LEPPWPVVPGRHLPRRSHAGPRGPARRTAPGRTERSALARRLRRRRRSGPRPGRRPRMSLALARPHPRPHGPTPGCAPVPTRSPGMLTPLREGLDVPTSPAIGLHPGSRPRTEDLATNASVTIARSSPRSRTQEVPAGSLPPVVHLAASLLLARAGRVRRGRPGRARRASRRGARAFSSAVQLGVATDGAPVGRERGPSRGQRGGRPPPHCRTRSCTDRWGLGGGRESSGPSRVAFPCSSRLDVPASPLSPWRPRLPHPWPGKVPGRGKRRHGRVYPSPGTARPSHGSGRPAPTSPSLMSFAHSAPQRRSGARAGVGLRPTIG
ncbi:MAG: hypothetical protein FD126_2287, partial [Elusimicrobia bacterium]